MKKEDMAFLLRCMPFLEKLSERERQGVYAAAFQASFARSDIILNRETECNGIVLVKAGQLRAFFETEDGKEITLYRLLPEDICVLTASCVLKNITFAVTLEAEKPSDVLFVPAALWATLAEANSVVKEFTMELVAERFSEVMWVMEQMVTKNMGQRVAAFLLEQAALERSESLALTHDAVARNLGTAREVVSRVLKYFENDGLIRLSRGRIELTDAKRLRAMSA